MRQGSENPLSEETAEEAITIIQNVGEALGLSQIEIRRVLKGEDGWQVKGFVEAALVAKEEKLKTDRMELAKGLKDARYYGDADSDGDADIEGYSISKVEVIIAELESKSEMR